MPARTTRQAARERILKAVMSELDRLIPEDESAPMRGGTFREWEDQADQFDRTVTTTLLQERAALDGSAQVNSGGRCPSCGSQRVYLEKKEPRKTEIQTPHGKVVMERQICRCRSCDRTFSPSGPGLESAGADADALAQGRRADGAGGGDAALRPGGRGAQSGLGNLVRRQADRALGDEAGPGAGGSAARGSRGL